MQNRSITRNESYVWNQTTKSSLWMRLARSSGRAFRQASSTKSASAEATCRTCFQRRGIAAASNTGASRAAESSSAAATRLFELLEQVAPEQKQWRERLSTGLASQSKGPSSKKLNRITGEPFGFATQGVALTGKAFAVIGSASSDVHALVSSLVQDPLHPDLLVQERHEHRGAPGQAAPLLLRYLVSP